MSAVERVSPLADVSGEAGTNTGGMIANVRQSMADLSDHAVADVRIKDLLAVDTFVPQEVRGGVAGEVALENAVALAAMVRTRDSGMQAVAAAVAATACVPAAPRRSRSSWAASRPRWRCSAPSPPPAPKSLSSCSTWAVDPPMRR